MLKIFYRVLYFDKKLKKMKMKKSKFLLKASVTLVYILSESWIFPDLKIIRHFLTKLTVFYSMLFLFCCFYLDGFPFLFNRRRPRQVDKIQEMVLVHPREYDVKTETRSGNIFSCFFFLSLYFISLEVRKNIFYQKNCFDTSDCL